MEARLMYPEKENKKERSYTFSEDLIRDFHLDQLIHVMGKQDEQILKIARRELLTPMRRAEDIRFRQEIIRDICKNREMFDEFFAFVSKTADGVQKFRAAYAKRHGSSGRGGISYAIDKLNCLKALTEDFYKLYELLEPGWYESRGFCGLWERLQQEYPKERLAEIAGCLKEVTLFMVGDRKFVVSAGFVEGLKLGRLRVNQVAGIKTKTVRQEKKLTLREQFGKVFLKSNVSMLQEETILGQEKELEAVAISHLLAVFDGYLEDSLNFYTQLFESCCFYQGCLNLIGRFEERGMFLCMPEAVEESKLSFRGLYDINLAIFGKKKPVGNDLSADKKTLIHVSGANQGGKSTWLRSVGTALVMMQCGMPVPAAEFKSRLYGDIFTHFGREEDRSMNSGRFDEELKRMDRMVEHMRDDSILFLNESFSGTTETEGSLILKNVTDALTGLGVVVIMVNHLFEYTQGLQKDAAEKGGESGVLFLSAERTEDTQRTFKIKEEKPAPTSYGLDLFREMIGEVQQ